MMIYISVKPIDLSEAQPKVSLARVPSALTEQVHALASLFSSSFEDFWYAVCDCHEPVVFSEN